MAESVPYEYLDSTGVIVPDTSSLLTDTQSEFQTVFGADLIVTPDTPQGVLITAETLARAEVVQNNAALANQINPNIAGGTFLDAILALTGMQRAAQMQTLVPNVALTGIAGTVIPAGTQAQTAAGDLFASATDVTLAADGTATVNFASVAYGPIPCAIAALDMVVSSVLGWETVTNATAGILGTTTQSDVAARALRQNTLAFNGISLAAAISSALFATPGVTSLFFQENIAATTQTINGISMVAHSVYACVAGGTDNDVAAALLENKSSGAAWNGETSVSLLEPASGQAYNVLFDRPTPVGVLVRVTTTNGLAANIIQAILDYAAGNISGLAGFTVGAAISPFEIAAAILTENPGYYISQVELSAVSPVSYSTNVFEIGVNEQATTQASYITVVISS